MKANLFGIEVEGTPQEIAQFKQELEEIKNKQVNSSNTPHYTYSFSPVYHTNPLKANEILDCQQ